jgi:Cu(I)/Ag(I) efflux system membrane protein CusA/SilA
VAPVGGFEPEYQITVDPAELRARDLSLSTVADAVRRTNSEAGGRIVEMSEREYFVRSRHVGGALT